MIQSQKLLYIVVSASLAILIVQAYFLLSTYNTGVFWDFSVYTHAVEAFNNGLNPYAASINGFKYLYPPATLRFLAFFGEFITPVLVLAYLASVVFLLKQHIRLALIGFCLASILFLFVQAQSLQAFFSGNLSFFLHLAIVAAWLRSEKSNRHGLFFALTLLAALFKPYFLAYCIMPAFIGRSASKLGQGIAVILITSVIWAAQYVYFHEEFSSLLDNLIGAVFEGQQQVWSGDIGYSLYREFAFITNSLSLGLVMHGVTWAIVLILLYWKYIKIDAQELEFEKISLLLLAICILLNPRLKVYDYAVANMLLLYYLATLYPSLASFAKSFPAKAFLFLIVSANLLGIVGMNLNSFEPSYIVENMLIYFPYIAKNMLIYSPFIIAFSTYVIYGKQPNPSLPVQKI